MPNPKIIRTRLADQDLTEIWHYIALGSPGRADRFLDTISQKIERISRSPRIGHARDELTPGLRSFPVGEYLIFYRIQRGRIEVIRVLSGYRDLDELLGT